MKHGNRYAAIALLVMLGTVAFYALRPVSDEHPRSALALPANGPMSVAAAGDIVIGRPIDKAERNTAFEAIVGVVRQASVGFANLEMNLLSSESADLASGRSDGRWTFGTGRDAEELASLGFDVLGHANNHALDYGVQGMIDTRTVLSDARLMTAGSGRDREEAGAPAILGDSRRRLAILAVAVSSSSAAAATPARAGSSGWPGINALRYAAEITADPETYATLRRSAAAWGEAPTADTTEFTLQGTVVKKGPQTAVNLVPHTQDVDGLLAAISRARDEADVVIVSLHSHEPSDSSEEPAEFVRTFARRAIDAGARLIIGHGPHRLRGVEIYNGGGILYSLGDFLLHPDEGWQPRPDDYSAGLDMFTLAMGMRSGRSAAGAAHPGDVARGAVAVATFAGARLTALHLHPVDLGSGGPGEPGIPRQPTPRIAAATLDTLVRLSRPFGTTIRLEDGVGRVEIE